MLERLVLLWKKCKHKLTGVVTLYPEGEPTGRALLSYITQPFLLSKNQLDSVPHTNYWECKKMAESLLQRGYIVDVIYWENEKFIPKKPYDLVIDLYRNLERLSPLLPSKCKKVMFIDAAYWQFQNNAEQKRIIDLEKRTGKTVSPRRQMKESHNISQADYIAGLGNEFTFGTYERFLTGKTIHPIPLSTIITFPSPENKDFDKIKKNFVWIGGGGAVHKGLDLVIESFRDMPEYQLTICGPIKAETDFTKIYHKELYELPNIKAVGRINVRGDEFRKITENSIALIYPSSSEGQSGSVVTSMHAGLIPLISYQSGVNVKGFGEILRENSIVEIKKVIENIANTSNQELKQKSIATWHYARTHNTKKTFLKSWNEFLDIVSEKDNQSTPLVSVIIPAHNSEKTIETAIRSILDQTYANIEIIVVDDNSTDTTREVIERMTTQNNNLFYYKLPYNDPHRIGKNGRNINAGYMARNFGIEKAKGEWITFQDADDASFLNRIETQINLARDYNALHVCLDWQQFNEEYLGKTIDVDKIIADKENVIIESEDINGLAAHTKGVFMKLFGDLHRFVPWEIKTMRVLNKLFFGSLDGYPGTGNSPLFHQSVALKVKFRQRNNRVWPSFVGRGADRDFNFQVAEIFGRNFVFKIPAYMWRVARQNLSYKNYEGYVTDLRKEDKRL